MLKEKFMSNFRIYNPTLCPDLWDIYLHLDPRVRVNLLRMAYEFYEKSKLPAPIIDIYLMGSIVNYNWTPDSDSDVHVIIDYNKLQMPSETAIKTIKTTSANWNLEHNVSMKGHKVEMNFQNSYETKPHVTGIYSLIKDQWIRKPILQPIQIDKNIIQIKYAGMKKYVDNALKSGSVETIKKVKEYIDAFRQYGLDTRGELSIENIVYKILRSKGIIQALKDGITALYDKEMTVKEENNNTSISYDYIGGIVDGEVRADPLPVGKAKVAIHNDFPGLCSGQNSTNWRYLKQRNLVLWNTPSLPEDKIKVDDFLLKRGIKSPKHKAMYTYSENINEVGEKDIKQVHVGPQVTRNSNGKLELSKMTLDNLKAMREKAKRFIYAAKAKEDFNTMAYEGREYKRYDDEIKRRLKYINSPITEDKFAYKNLYIGIIDTDTFKVHGKRADLMSDKSHLYFINPSNNIKYDDVFSWRFRADTGILYWWGMPTQKYIDEVSNWIKQNIGTNVKKNMSIHTALPSFSASHGARLKENFYDYMSDYDKDLVAAKYFSIGHETDDETSPKNYCWMWNGHDVIAKQGGSHGIHFGHDVTDRTFKGWYDVDKNMVSVVFPESELNNFDDNYQPTEDDIPQYLYSKLMNKFGKNNPKIYVLEGYGAGIPEEDPLHIKGERWRIKFGSRKTPKLDEDVSELIDTLVSESIKKLQES